ncbi:MAG: hypothetical protein OEW25_00050 [Nitrospira sp.]|nr:hypothetical protein [Nitrospira sp.]MDH5251689.1 hypothetical protein [Nitrospira sp.]
MGFEGLHEPAHVIVGGAGSIDPCRERRCVTDLSRPSQDILIGPIDLPGCSGRCNRKFIAGGPKIWPLGCQNNLTNHASKDLITGCKFDAPFDLDFKHGGSTMCVVGMYDHVIERVSLGSPLERDAIDNRTWQATGFRAC